MLLVYDHLRHLQLKNTRLIHLFEVCVNQERATRSTIKELFDYHIISYFTPVNTQHHNHSPKCSLMHDVNCVTVL